MFYLNIVIIRYLMDQIRYCLKNEYHNDLMILVLIVGHCRPLLPHYGNTPMLQYFTTVKTIKKMKTKKDDFLIFAQNILEAV